LTSDDGVAWKEEGPLAIRTRSGEPLSPGPYGTPSVWIEGDTWYLFYERDDKGVWLATSKEQRKDRRVWTNVQDEPVIALGPEAYDRHAVALNQVVRYKGRYYGVYHANADPDGRGRGRRASRRLRSRDVGEVPRQPDHPQRRLERDPGGRRRAPAALHHASRRSSCGCRAGTSLARPGADTRSARREEQLRGDLPE
jgi:hypothetical protein